MPVVSWPWQNFTVPLGGLFSELGSMTLAPVTFTAPVDPPPPPLLLLLPPHAAKARQAAASTPRAPTSLKRRPLCANPLRSDMWM